MKKIAFTSLGVIHILLILFVSFISSYSSYCDFYEIEQNKMVKKTCAAIGKNYFIRTYLRFSGTETGYGFFAPNVKSGGAVLAKINKNTIVPEFNSFEGTLRYNCLSSEILDYVYKKKNTTSKNIVKERYQELVLKNIATKLLNSNSTLSDSITVSFGIIKFPSLEEARQGMNVIPTLLKCKELKYSVRNEAAKF